MLKTEAWLDIKLLRKQGHSIRKIARLTGVSRNSIRKVLRQAGVPAPYNSSNRSSILDSFKPYVQKRYTECGLSAVRVLKEIRSMGYGGSVWPVRRYLQKLKSPQRRLIKATVRFETAPGQQGQVDWAYCGQFLDEAGVSFRVYMFIFVLSFSRMMYVRFTTSMKLPSFIDCHLSAFKYFNGWPASILYDNMKQVRCGPENWNLQFLDFTNYYGIVPKTHRPYRPRTKGKVERMVDYTKNNFLVGRSFGDINDLNAQGLCWLNQTANVRIHGTTKQRPTDLLTQEQLTPFSSIAEYRFAPWIERKVDSEGFVNFRQSRYSVPPQHVGRSVIVQLQHSKVRIRTADTIVAEHNEATRRGSVVTHPEHVSEMWKISVVAAKNELPRWHIGNTNSVQERALSVYDEVSR